MKPRADLENHLQALARQCTGGQSLWFGVASLVVTILLDIRGLLLQANTQAASTEFKDALPHDPPTG